LAGGDGVVPSNQPLTVHGRLAGRMQPRPGMLIKVYKGTRQQVTESLCETCRHSRIVRGRAQDEEIVFCDVMAMQTVRITFVVSTCSEYSDAREPSYHELVEQAWILTPASRRRPAGFVRSTDLRDEEVRRYLSDHRRDRE
jgi:hypothetical protein